MRRAFAASAVILLISVWSAPAKADPCDGALPVRGAQFSGMVRYVGDGDGLCVGPKARPDQWIEVRLADFYAPELDDSGGIEAKRRLERLVLGKMLVCRAGRRSYDRVIARCTLAGQPVGALLLARGGVQGGRGWRP